MKKIAFIPTRESPNSKPPSGLKKTTQYLWKYFTDAGWKVEWLVKKDSIFTAFSEACIKNKITKDDYVILCHDDIQILWGQKEFNEIIESNLKHPMVGFLGLAGSSCLGKSNPPCKWWGEPGVKRKGAVFHGPDINTMYLTTFGSFGNVVVLDGVFLCTKGNVINSIQLTKPKTFKGGWDFYDIFYTFQAHLNGFTNKVIPLSIRHESPGVPRADWELNRVAFLNLFKEKLPCIIN